MVGVGRTELSLWFGEAIDTRATRFLLRTVEGQPVEVTVSASDDVNDGFFKLGTPPLDRGIYVLDWQALSAEDGHTSQGSLLFGAGMRPDAVPSAESAWPGWMTLLVRWVDLAALLTALGAVAVTGRILARCAPAARRRGVALGVAACAIGLAPAVVTPFLRTPRAAEPLASWAHAALVTLRDTQWGHLWLLHGVGLILAGVALTALVRRADARWPRPVAGLALAAVVVTDAAAGHAADLPRGSGVATIVTSVHVLAAGAWVGGLAVLAICVLPGLRCASEPRRRVLLGALRAFSPLAAVCAAALLGSGLYLGGRQVPDLQAVRTTWYGGAAAGKTAAVALTLVVAAFTTMLVNPRLAASVGRRLGQPDGWSPLPRERIVRLVGAELALLVAAVGLAAVMTSTPTARVEAATRDVAAPRTATVDGIFLSFEGVPAGAGEERVIVRTSEVTRPQPGPVTGVDVLFVGPDERTSTVVLRQIEPGRFEGATDAPEPGTWEVWIAVRRPPAPDAIAQVEWRVLPTRELPSTTFERVGTTVGWLLMTLAAIGGVLLLRRRGRSPEPEPEPVDEPARPPVRLEQPEHVGSGTRT